MSSLIDHCWRALSQWHLGSFYNDSQKTGGVFSSPVFHGFDDFNSTVGVAPTATTNCGCRPEWEQLCIPGHYVTLHGLCHGGTNPGPGIPVNPHPAGTPGCCYNCALQHVVARYVCSRHPRPTCCADWWRNDSASHAVSNLTEPVGQDDSVYLTEAFVHFLELRQAARKPFVVQIAYHNCHVSPTCQQCVSTLRRCVFDTNAA